MNPRLDNIINEFSKQRYSEDVFEKTMYAVGLEDALLRIFTLRYLDYNSIAELELLGIPIIKYIGEFRNITVEEARSLADYKYVTADIVLDVLEFILKK